MPTEVVIKEFGGSENLELSKFSLQSPNSNEVTVEHTAIGLNYIDIYQRLPDDVKLKFGRSPSMPSPSASSRRGLRLSNA